jgi:purine-nucleoside/S-methyl-5'-thioadenosine phosphorylase / adenosine deaminase
MAPHLFTTRQLQFRDESVPRDYARLGQVLGVAGDHIVRVRQVHGRTVLTADAATVATDLVEADAIVGRDVGRVVSVRTADCVPILLADRGRRLVAAIHAGWRGTVAGVAAATVELIEALGVPAADLVAAIGPAIGPCCYQVDDLVHTRFTDGWSRAPAWFVADGDGHWRLDLPAANAAQLIDAGLRPDAVHQSGQCTAHQPGRWHSHRRDGADAGRMVAAIQLVDRA